MEFFRELSIVSQPMQHSKAAANNNRQNTFAAHNANGKAQIWFTFSPDDTQSLLVMMYALGPNASAPYAKTAPIASHRFKLIATKPASAALHFERIIALVIKHIIGWDTKSGKAFKKGGLFGHAKAWLISVEEQARLTLHGHGLIWICGHSDIAGQFNRATAETIPESQNVPTGMTQPRIGQNVGLFRFYFILF